MLLSTYFSRKIFDKIKKKRGERGNNCSSVCFEAFKNRFIYLVWRASEQFALGGKESRRHHHHSRPVVVVVVALCVCVEWQTAKKATPIFRTEKLCFAGWSSKVFFIPRGIFIYLYFSSFFFFKFSWEILYVFVSFLKCYILVAPPDLMTVQEVGGGGVVCTRQSIMAACLVSGVGRE